MEAIDDVRVLTNRSSGKMGYAVARAALEAGCRVTLVSGPVALAPPAARRGALRLVRVESAREMAAAAIPAFRRCDLAFHVAAVADFRPAARIRGKLKKGRALSSGGGVVRLALVANPDILWSCGRIKHEMQILVGFALESADGERNARAKLRAKNLDFVVWNDPSALNADRSNVTVLGRDGERIPLRGHKSGIGRRLVALALQRWQRRSHETHPRQRTQRTRRRPRRRA